MLKSRVIPVLLLRNGGLVKGQRFKDHVYIGDPINAVKIFNEKEVDELVFLDIAATSQGADPDFDLLADVSSQAFMPISYGGGITSPGMVEKLLKLGTEKAVINTSAFDDLDLIRDSSSIAGSQSIVVSIDVHRNMFGRYHVRTQNGRKKTKLNPVDYAKAVEEAGAGEIILCSINNEGMGIGYDLDLVNSVSAAVDIPVVASGGAGTLQHFKSAVANGASAVAAGSMFCFHGKHRAVLITYPTYQELENLFAN
jgi:cyclase